MTLRGLALAAMLVLPPVHAGLDYQLGGAYRPAAGVTMVTRDRTADAAPGVYSVCYVNGFQTQADADAWWRGRHPSLLLRDAAGHEVEDPGWPGEILLDTRTAATRARIATIVGGWFAGCARHGFRAVEPDNLDSWTRSRGLLHRRDDVAMARLLARRAHAAGLAIAQKNAAELAPQGRSIGFDFAVAEQCQTYHECGVYMAAYGRRVYEIEYPDSGGLAGFRAACRARGARISIVYRDRDLRPRGAAGYVRRSC